MLHSHALNRAVGRLALVWLMSIALGWTAALAQPRTFHFDIPGTTLSQALREFGRVSGQEIIFTEDLVAGMTVAALRGDFTADRALERLLKGTGLAAERSGSGALMIRRQSASSAAAGTTPHRVDVGPGSTAISQDGANQQGQTPRQDTPAPGVAGPDSGAAASKQAFANVIVTAEKRTERAIDVPISLTTIDTSTIEATGATNLEDLQSAVPGLTSLSYTPGGNNFIEMRGVSDSDGLATVGRYFDEIPVNLDVRAYVMDVRFLDLKQVEVLEGPQPTLYGDGSMGGTIRYVPAPPTLNAAPSGALAADFTSLQNGGTGWLTHGDLDFSPIPDRVGLRIAAWYETDGGWIDRVPTGETNINTNTISTLRATLLAKLTDSTELKLLWQHGATQAPNQNFGDNGETLLSVPTYANTSSDLLEAVFRADLGFAELVETPSFQRFSLHEQFDLSPFLLPVLPVFGIPPGYVTEIGLHLYPSSDLFYNELRLVSKTAGGWSWMAGFDFKNSNVWNSVGTTTAPNSLPFQISVANEAQPDTTESLWGEVGYAFSDRWRASVGARYFRDHVEDFSTSLSFGHDLPPTANAGTFTSTNPRLDITYAVGPDWNLYFNAAKGFRSGGFNPGYPLYPSYAPDEMWTEELGSKGLYFDHKLELDAAVYYNNWKNAQDTITLPSALVIISNGGTIRGEGVELHATLRPVEGLQLGATFGWNNMAYGQVPAGLDHAEGDPPDFAVRQSWSAFTEYRRPVAPKASLYGRFDFQHSDRAQVTERTPGYPAMFSNIPPRSLLNLHLGLTFDRYDVSLYADNALNERNPIIQAPFGDLTEDVEQRPRLYGVSLRYAF